MMPGPGSGSGTPVPPIDNSEVCNAAFTITGTFTADATTPPPTDPDTGAPLSGCWPVGTWNFTAKLDASSPNNCTTQPAALQPAVLPSYSFKVARTPDPDGGTDTIQTLAILTTLSGGMQSHLAMSSNGQGCEGSVEFGSADGTQYWNMKPTLAKLVPGTPAPTTISGGGDYVLYKGNSWPWK